MWKGGVVVPFDRLILNFSILVVQRSDNPVDCTSSSAVVMSEKVIFSDIKNRIEIAQGHEPKVGVRIIDSR
jgi:hypothetical protein